MARSMLPDEGNPNTSVSEFSRKGKRIRRRFYGADGKAKKTLITSLIMVIQSRMLTIGIGQRIQSASLLVP